MNITADELLKELKRLDGLQPEGFTVNEMMMETGHSDNWCRKKLRLLIECGSVVFNGHRSITDISGRNARSPVYKIIRGKK